VQVMLPPDGTLNGTAARALAWPDRQSTWNSCVFVGLLLLCRLLLLLLPRLLLLPEACPDTLIDSPPGTDTTCGCVMVSRGGV
jgi:hypothetical protein